MKLSTWALAGGKNATGDLDLAIHNQPSSSGQAGDTMGDLDLNMLADAARRYTGLRRRYWRFLLVGILIISGAGLFGMFQREFGPLHNPVVGRVLMVCLIAGFLACWTGAVVTWAALMRFRCPRCGKRFTLSWYSSWPTSRCKHCQLDLGPAAETTAKLPPVWTDELTSGSRNESNA